jgi:predicted cupin superfamily sugar epimerase
MNNAQYWIEKLELLPHPEGGFYKEMYRSEEIIDQTALPERYIGNRSFATQIYFMLLRHNHSSFHRLNSDETWHFYDGSPVIIYLLSKKTGLQEISLGISTDSMPQFTIPKNCWFAAEVRGEGEFSLIGCTVAPGFDFADFELAKRGSLFKEFPFETVNRLSLP